MDKQNDLNYSKVNNMFKVSFKDNFMSVLTFQNKITVDSELGKRIAESRAKMRIYKFMYMLTKKLLCYYFGIMYGNREVDLVRESCTKPPKDCVMIACNKYKALWIKESHHLGELLQQV